MNKNANNYKKAVDKIEASEKLKEATFEKIQNKKPATRMNLKQLIAICATFVVVVTAGVAIFNNKEVQDLIHKRENSPLIADAGENLPRFSNIDELKKVLEENNSYYRNYYKTNGAIMEADVAVPTGQTSSATSTNTREVAHSTTNTQVKGVDEADIVKTDGQYIYYVTEGKLVIVDAKNLELLAEIKDDDIYNYYSSIQEIFINGNNVIVFGTKRVEEKEEEDPDVRIYKQESSETRTDIAPTTNYKKTYTMAVAKVYDISKKTSPKLVREVGLEGYYHSARMIDDNIYLIANKYVYYYKGNNTDDEDLLPRVLDTAKGDEAKRVNVTQIGYFEESKTNNNFLEVAGFKLNSSKEASIEIVLGASDEIYASQNNLYAVDSYYNYGRIISDSGTHIFKFQLNDGKIKLMAKGEVSGTVHDQFSMDEYNGYLRIATTGENLLGNDTNRLFVLNDKLEKVGELTGIAVGEQIKSVRFMGKVAYIVTYEQIDPLFVVDLSNPTMPVMRGELEIPGYSAYLHPYDETHIIGIGYDTFTNQYGGTQNSSLKMSMFDVSDLDNPKEIFNVKIGDRSTSSEITYNHKALFYYKEKNLIGFPMTSYSYGSSTGFVLYKIDLDKNEFKKYGELKNDSNYWNSVRRIIYIGEDIFSLSNKDITKYDMETAEQKGKLTIQEEEYRRGPVYIYDDVIDVVE